MWKELESELSVTSDAFVACCLLVFYVVCCWSWLEDYFFDNDNHRPTLPVTVTAK